VTTHRLPGSSHPGEDPDSLWGPVGVRDGLLGTELEQAPSHAAAFGRFTIRSGPCGVDRLSAGRPVQRADLVPRMVGAGP
jgi:hypothetical protein